jgi:ankyrin repeat protein
MLAAFHGKLGRIKQLLRAGADIEACFESWNPLHAAIENWQTEAVQLLLDYGANPNALVHGWTPLFHALETEWDVASNRTPFQTPMPELSAILIRRGADPNLPAPDGRSLIAYFGSHYENAVGMLEAAGGTR